MFKKILLLGLSLFMVFTPAILKASSIEDFTGQEGPENIPVIESGTETIPAIQSLILKIIELILSIIGVTGVIIIILGGFMYVINFGEDSMRDKAKNTIFYGVVGILCVLLAYAAVENTIRYLYDDIEEGPDAGIDVPEKPNFVQ